MKIKEIFKVSSIPVAVASLCCLSPIILVVLGIGTVSFASSLADTLYGSYKWYFRIAGLLAMIIALVLYLRRTKGICTMDEVKKRRNEIINIVSIVVISSVVGYIIFLYVILHYLGVFLNLWGNPKVMLPAATSSSLSITTKTALMAGGCFWCVEADFEKLPGVTDVVSGYAGGAGDNPTYENYAEGGYREVVKVSYDGSKLSYASLVEYLIKHSDVTDGQGSFHDRGPQYAPAVYYDTTMEKDTALEIIKEVDVKKIYDKSIDLAVIPRVTFYPAEEYHQDYYKKNPIRYSYYRNASGRDAFVKKYWGDNTGIEGYGVVKSDQNSSAKSVWKDFKKPSDAQLRTVLTQLQYKVTQEKGTEKPFDNAYDKNKEDGIYVDILSGEPLYSSKDKYDSGTGWPSFVKPITADAVKLKEDNTFFNTRTEVRSVYADSHLGHMFDDGPADRGGKRYCMNSASMRFISKAQMEKEGYGDYLKYI